jgi:glutamyl-tRNA reductase
VSLSLVDQPIGHRPLPSDAPVWRTCLREVAFVGETVAPAGATLVTDGEAYGRLVEIVCGLRSPILGETEVQAQFKAFLASLAGTSHRHLIGLGQRVLADVKTIRHRYLQGVGAHSYGALTVSRVPADSHVVLVGHGALASQVRAALGHTRPVDVWTRRPVSEPTRLLSWAATCGVVSSDRTTLVVAAPAVTADLLPLVTCYPRLSMVVDVRASDDRSAWPIELSVITLDDIFSAADRAPAALERIAAARRAIDAIARDYQPRDHVRPLGWEDVCA